ncbi:hypothetical protein [Halarcobacter sp.]|uniref:hypothetical protein n=1 Tax=Halarcobacter sp. TaxID=2321133 RepID=UPI002AAAD902|nr:hypothetical protein [Halarcobacter sp.]
MDRKNVIQIRNIETDMIKNFVEYAKLQGSRSSNMYYVNFTKLVYSTFDIKSGNRDSLTPQELNIISTSEMIINNELEKTMSKNIGYKDIFKKVKKRIREFAIFIKN